MSDRSPLAASTYIKDGRRAPRQASLCEELLSRKLAKTLPDARNLIISGQVKVRGEIVTDAFHMVDPWNYGIETVNPPSDQAPTAPRLLPEFLAAPVAQASLLKRAFNLVRQRPAPAPKSIMPPSASAAHGLVALSEVLAETHGGDRIQHMPAAIELALRLSERGWSLTKDATA